MYIIPSFIKPLNRVLMLLLKSLKTLADQISQPR